MEVLNKSSGVTLLASNEKNGRKKTATEKGQKGAVVCVWGLGLGNGHEGRKSHKGDPELECVERIVVGSNNNQSCEEYTCAAFVRAGELSVEEFALCSASMCLDTKGEAALICERKGTIQLQTMQ